MEMSAQHESNSLVITMLHTKPTATSVTKGQMNIKLHRRQLYETNKQLQTVMFKVTWAVQGTRIIDSLKWWGELVR